MASFAFYTDPGLTTPLSGSLDFAQALDGSTGAVVATLYLGSTAPARILRAASNPGVDPIVLSITDSSAGGSPASDLTLGLEETFSGRAPGAALTLGFQINGGIPNAVPVYVRAQDSTGDIGLHTDLALVLTPCEEV